MEEIKIKGSVVSMKFNNDSEKSKPDESNYEDSIKSLGDEFRPGDKSGLQTVETTSDQPKK